MLSIDWRFPAAYRHAKHIPAAGFAWEYLRRNHDYRQEFRNIARTGGRNGRDLEAFAARWGVAISRAILTHHMTSNPRSGRRTCNRKR